MTRFRYSFLQRDGTTTHEVAEAADLAALAARLQRERRYLLRAAPEHSWRALLGGLRLNSEHASMVLTLHELGSLVKAGLPVDRGLAVVAELLPEPGLRAALLRVRDAVRRGSGLADALAAEPGHFTALHVNLVRAGEAGGALDEALLRLAEHLRQHENLRSQIQTALIYPVILMLVGAAALVLLATVVLPQLQPIFADAGRQMPLPTRMILAASAFLQQFGWLMAILLAVTILLIRRRLAEPGPRMRWDRFKLRVPLVGPVILTVETARFARTAGTLLKSGVSLPVALGLARQTLSNSALSDALRGAAVEVRGGKPLTDALRKSGIFPGLTAQLVSVGEETGHLDEMLVHQAELFERQVARRIETLVAVLVPGITIVIGVSVAGVLAAILLAVMQLNELAS